MKIALGLIHYPIWDSANKIVATNVTNLDVHDIARACRVYGVERYYIIHPMQDQLMFVSRLLEHWRIGDGAKFNPMRRTALNMVHTAPSLENALQDWGGDPYVISTHARALNGVPQIGFRDLHDRICKARGLDLHGEPLPGMGEENITESGSSAGSAISSGISSGTQSTAGAALTGAARGFCSGGRSGLEKNANGRIFDGVGNALHSAVESVSVLNHMAAARAIDEAGPESPLTSHQEAAQKNMQRNVQSHAAKQAPKSAAKTVSGSGTPFAPAGVIKSIENFRGSSSSPRVDADDDERIFLCFGTGFGLTEETMRACDYLLEPIRGASSDDYRHLSVRSAVSICLDRLFGPW